MKNKRRILIIILLIVICSLVYIVMRIAHPTIIGVIIKSNGKNITFMDVKDESLYNINVPQNNDLQFKPGQKILVHYKYDAIIEQTLPASIRTEDIKKITILREKSNVKIPREKLGKVYNSWKNVLITIDELTPTGMSITINDTNEFKKEYQHSNYFELLKGKHDEAYSKLTKNNNIATTVNSIKIDNNGTVRNTYNWENIYGKLESGEYYFKTSTSDYYINIFIYFTIDEHGKITYSKIKGGLLP